MFKYISTCLLVVFLMTNGFAQSIRKNYMEMTPTEITDYKAALQLLWASGSTAAGCHMYFANAHGKHFGENVHSFSDVLPGVNFTAFHRYFLLQWEQSLRSTKTQYNYLTLPYWDWRTDPDRSLTTVTATNSPNFIIYSLLPSTSLTPWQVNRNSSFSGTSASLPTDTKVGNTMAKSTFFIDSQEGDCFSRALEFNHNGPHVWIGGNMNSGISPKDPVFYNHHCMIDKLWQDWEDDKTGIQSVFPAGAKPIPHFKKAAPDNWIDDLIPDSCADSRNIRFRLTTTQPVDNKYEVWYAENGIVLLDGANGQDFVSKGTKIYRYGAYNRTTNKTEGVIYVGDVKRTNSGANTVVADNKGGFVVDAGATCTFRAGKEISFKPGTTLKAGSTVNAKIAYP